MKSFQEADWEVIKWIDRGYWSGCIQTDDDIGLFVHNDKAFFNLPNFTSEELLINHIRDFVKINKLNDVNTKNYYEG